MLKLTILYYDHLIFILNFIPDNKRMGIVTLMYK